MPSGHVAFTVLAVAVVFTLARPLAVRLLALLQPPLIATITLLTANHFWLDVLACAGIAIGARSVRGRVPSGARHDGRSTRDPPPDTG